MPPRNSLRQPAALSQTQRKRCRFCNNLDPRGHPNTLYPDSTDGKTSLTLVLAAFDLSRTKAPENGGCRFCNVLIQALDAFCISWRGSRQRITIDLKEKGPLKLTVDNEVWKGRAIELYAASASKPAWPTLGTAHHIPSNAGSDDTFQFARRCIQDCVTNPKHRACKPPHNALAVPKRLLDVGRVSAPIRLIDTQGKSFQYATLSHRWGDGPNLTATKQNWQKLSSNIPFETLPPLFQDATIITRQLGLRYIWIDSLCIIQDSARDWETESSKMAAIYENSYITIAAVDSADGNDRCLVDRLKPVRINYKNTMGKEFTVRARKVVEHHPNAREKEPAKPMGPLTTRAWALQEHVLSTRVLHYTSTELLFECRTSYRCECMPMRKMYPTTPSIIPKSVAKKDGGLDPVWHAWQRIVEQYSRRELTVQNDKFPAISGIASKIKEATQSPYIAGLWKMNIASDLIWSAAPPLADNALQTYRAPTFSWASLKTPITYYEADAEETQALTSTIELLSSAVTLTGLNPLGTIAIASIKLRAPCLPALLSSEQRDGKWEYNLLIKGTSAIRVLHDCLLAEVTNVDKAADTQRTVRRAQLEDTGSSFRAPVLCLSVARYDTWVSGLVLASSEVTHGAYERLGTFASGVEIFQKAQEQDVQLV
jgi:hypothetical protein